MKIKYKHVVAFLALATIVNVIGALRKILHWEFPIVGIGIGGSKIIGIGIILWITIAISLIIKVITTKGNDFLNR